MELLRIQNVEKYYGNKSNLTRALSDVSLTVEKGEFVAIMGASGSGKTTLLNCVATIDRVTAGHIFYDDVDVTELKGKKLNEFRRNNLGFIFQEYNLLDTLNGFENISLALSIKKESRDAIDEEITKLATELGINDILDKYPSQMSGGQKQRVAAARAFVTNPGIILADEPTGALDSKASRLLLEKMCKLNKDFDTSILMVTHDGFSASYASRVIILKDGKVFNELSRGEDSRKVFFDRIMEVVTLLGGDLSDAF